MPPHYPSLFARQVLPGLFGDPEPMVRPNAHMVLRPMSAPPPERQPTRGRMGPIADALGVAFGGMDDPRLGAEQNERARKQAMLMAGLATLASDQTGLKAIAQGALAGQQFGMQGREGIVGQQAEAAKVQQREQLKQLVSSGEVTPDLLRSMFAQSIASGDIDAARSLAEVLKSMGGSQSSLPSLQVKEGVNPATGKPEQYTINPHTGEIKWMGVSPVVSPTSTTSDVQAQRAFARENQLVDDFDARTKPIREVYNLINGTLSAVPAAKAGDGASQNELVVTFVRALDPESVAREGEVELARSAASIWDRVQGAYKKYIAGESVVLPPELIGQMESMLRRRLGGYDKQWRDAHDNYSKRAKRWGVNPEVFMSPPATGGPRKAPPGVGRP